MNKAKILDTLQASIYSAQSINDYYIADGFKHWVWTNMSDEIPGEKWKQCSKNYPGCSASNFGRIRKDGRILEQYEEHYPDYTPKQILQLLLAGATNVGWLCVDAGPRGGAVYVYTLVADAWLNFEHKTGIEIHHKSNDGYDNSPDNLIALDTDTHKKINHSGLDNDKYPGPKWKK
ncbi:MAG: hypothetical protein J6S74_01755 [Alphaproteobacteria bacterium]|nr:hypothetical protein [Alphaproteobacteria bacterium]